MDGTPITMPGSMNGQGSTKILSFEEFVTAQQGGMSVPGGQPNMPPQPEMPPTDMPEPEGEADLTLLDGPEGEAGAEGPEVTPEPASGEKETPPAEEPAQ